MTITVIRPGLLTTVQDLGRRGHQHEGVPEGGVMDSYAARLANLLAGNDQGAAVLEATLVGPELRFPSATVVAVTGMDCDVLLDGQPVALWRTLEVPPGSTLEVGAARTGCRAYIAVAGGIDVPAVLGSRSTYLPAAFGGFHGRALRAGDVLSSGGAAPQLAGRAGQGHGRTLARSLRPDYGPVLRLIPGESRSPGRATAGSVLDQEFKVSRRSDRMGYRLDGRILDETGTRERPSAAVTMGTLQLPPDGSPILLMADRQTTGGYPTLGQVATVDLGRAAQLRPGSTVRFTEVSTEEAQRLYLDRERALAALERALGLSH